jgi:hypothetical protein
MQPDADQEIKDALKIYKIAGPIIIIILLIGVMYAVFKPAPEPIPQPMPIPAATPEPTPETTPEPANITPTNITTNMTQNITQPNITTNVTQNITLNVSATATPTPTPQVINYAWEGIVVNFPVTNGEQFELDFFITDSQGKDTEVVATFESNKWLISLLITNKGNYTFTVALDCEAQKGHCQRLYPQGSTQKSTIVEVV